MQTWFTGPMLHVRLLRSPVGNEVGCAGTWLKDSVEQEYCIVVLSVQVICNFSPHLGMGQWSAVVGQM